MSEERDQPVAEEGVMPESQGVADEANAQGDDEPQLDEDGNPIEGQAEDDDSEDVEYEGKTFRGPKGLKDALLRQADYTRKTQEIADIRKALEARQAEADQQAEAQQATLEQRVQLAQIDAALKQYAELDWDEYAEQYGDRAAIKAQGQWQSLRSAREALSQEITQKEGEHRAAAGKAVENAINQAHEVLQREVAGYGHELVAKVAQTAEQLGISREELRQTFVGNDGKPDIRTFKALAELVELRAYKAANEAKNTKAQTAEKVAKVQPAQTVSARANGYKPGLNDDLPGDEWLRRRNAQLSKGAGR